MIRTSGERTFDQWWSGTIHSEWVWSGDLHMYVRHNAKQVWNRYGQVTIANIQSNAMGQGGLTQFLNKWESQILFSFENVFNMRLVCFLARRGYQIRTEFDEYPPCMLFDRALADAYVWQHREI